VFASRTEFQKDPTFYSNLGLSNSLLALTDPQRHKSYRDALTPLFSKRRMEEIGIMLSKILEKGTDIKPDAIRKVDMWRYS